MNCSGLRGRFHLGDAAGTAHAADVGSRRDRHVDHGEAGGVVTAVFEPLEAFDQDGDHIAIRDCANDSAHSAELLQGID